MSVGAAAIIKTCKNCSYGPVPCESAKGCGHDHKYWSMSDSARASIEEDICEKCAYRGYGGHTCANCKLLSVNRTETKNTYYKLNFKERISDMFSNDKLKKQHDSDAIDAFRYLANSMYGIYSRSLSVKNVIFNDPATIVIWSDGVKTIVKCADGDVFDPEKGLAMAIVKRVFGNKGYYNNIIKKWLPKEDTVDGAVESNVKSEETPSLYSVKEAAEKLSMSEDTVRARIKSGKLSAKKEKGKWVISGID